MSGKGKTKDEELSEKDKRKIEFVRAMRETPFSVSGIPGPMKINHGKMPRTIQ